MASPKVRSSVPAFVVGLPNTFRIYGKNFGNVGDSVVVNLISQDKFDWASVDPNIPTIEGMVIHPNVVEVTAIPSVRPPHFLSGTGLGDLTVTVSVTNPDSSMTVSAPQSDDVIYAG